MARADRAGQARPSISVVVWSDKSRPCGVSFDYGTQSASLVIGFPAYGRRMRREPWPMGTVRSWQGVYQQRQESGYADDEADRIRESKESSRIHELRGLMMAQVAEVEDLLVTLHRQLDSPPANEGRWTTAKRILALLGDMPESGNLQQQLDHMEWLLERRNQLVHARVHVGYAYSQFNDSREAVVVLLQPVNFSSRAIPWHKAPVLAAPRSVQADSDEIDEELLEDDLDRAHLALESAVDVYQALSPQHSL
jgi:hypothetical protein